MPRTPVARFEIQYLQVLDEEGRADPDLDPDLPSDELLRLYRVMLLTREVDARQLKLQRQGRIGTFPLTTGQEAAMCGPASVLREQDWLVPSFRELGALLLRGASLPHVFLANNGFEEGNVAPVKGRTLPPAIIVASQVLHAVGIAWAMRHKGEPDTAVLTFLGDGGTSEGDFYEALNFAGVWKAPVVFVVQNNQWAISVPRARQTAAETLAQKGLAAGVPGIQVDGNDVLGMVLATREALARARAGDGPTVIEAVTYRLMQHTTSDDPRKYRTEDEEQAWWPRDPLRRFRVYLERRGILDEDRHAALEAEVRAEVDEAVRVFEGMGPFPADTPFDHVYGTRHPIIEAQRAEFLKSLEEEAREVRDASA